MISGIIPAMVYYGLKILDPNIFLPACVVICSIISVATGSSWTTSATVGIALVGIGKALGIPPGMVGGAVIAGAYFGDKLSPLSDTTNLAAAITKVDLFRHIKYLTYTTIPSISITLIVFIILGFMQLSDGPTDNTYLLTAITEKFNITAKRAPTNVPITNAVKGGVFLIIIIKTNIGTVNRINLILNFSVIAVSK